MFVCDISYSAGLICLIHLVYIEPYVFLCALPPHMCHTLHLIKCLSLEGTEEKGCGPSRNPINGPTFEVTLYPMDIRTFEIEVAF